MKGCARTCLLWLGLWILGGAAFFVHLRGLGFIDPQIFWASGICGLFVAICAAYAFNIDTARRERATLLGAISGEPPRDGEWIAVSGTIRALNPLRAPLSGTPVVAYSYKISEPRRTSKGSSLVEAYDGKRLTPSTIATRHGSVRLLAVPAFDVPAESVSSSTAIPNAEAYLAATQFQTSDTPKRERIGVNEESTDDDGNFRVDRAHVSDSVDLTQCQFEEHLVRQGEVVCAFGLYDRQRGGIVPHPNWANQPRIMRGDANVVAVQLRKRITRYAIGIVAFAAAAYGIVKWYEYAAR